MKLEKQNPHERDKRIEFNEKEHIYSVDEKDLDISVTGFVHEFFGKFDANKIIEKYYNMWQSNENSKYFGMEKEEIKDMWDFEGKKSAELGTALHNAIELYYNGEEHDSKIPEFDYFLNFNEDHKHLQEYRTEWKVFTDSEFKLAGTIDMCFEENGKIHIYDWKRSKEIKEQNKWQSGLFPVSHLPDTNYWHYSLQLNIYKYILEKYYSKDVEEMFLVVLHLNNVDYVKIKVVDLQDEVAEILDMRRRSLQ